MFSKVTLLTTALLCSIPFIHAGDFWTVNCGVLSSQRSDPIISPGIPSGHVHAISGGTAFNRTMVGADSASKGKATTCDKFTDHSNYWAPQLYNRMNDGMFQLVPYSGANMYYKRYTCSYQAGVQYCPRPADAKPFPSGLRMVAGDPQRRTQNTSDQTNQAILYETGNSGEVYGFPKRLLGDLSLHVRFPSCWDGVNVDSPDHKSHMAYPDPTKGDTAGGMCPSTHPVALLHIGAEFGFDTGSLGIVDSSTLVWSMGDTTGYGGHGDFIQGWQNLTALGESFDNCEGTGTACAWNSFGTPNGEMGTKSNLSPEIAPPVEDIGFQGPISKLPGGNVAYGGGAGSQTTSTASSSVPTTMATVTRAASSSNAAGIVKQTPSASTILAVTKATSSTTTAAGIVLHTPATTSSASPATTSGAGTAGDDGHDACEL
ncbi:uncharacterized protein PAC_05702 [Phialocephala subalpina]|uniref:DUF1996 domain-containing protein n=1 Tax=Phialocephala subalpina TaxID=576137 RepID=A0A1L7WSS2_9HELO|nr:uncharacterized protein PAC_05702 [Phialocephala subalpina]